MKQFLINIKFFILINLSIIVLLVSGTYFIPSSVSFRIPDDRTILIAGDSLTARAIDDNIFSCAINISQPGTAYLYTYVKLRKFLDVNPHINQVILSFHGDSIQKSKDKWTIGSKNILTFVPTHFSLFTRDEIFLLIKKASFFSAVTKSPIRSIIATFKMVTGRNGTYKDLNIGGYMKLFGEYLEKDLESKRNIEEEKDEYSQYQLDYLLKIVELCQEKNIKLVLFRSPMYNSEKYGSKILLMNCYDNYFSGIKYLDFSDFVLPENGYYDISHLNHKGAEIFSQYLENNYFFQ